MASVYSSHDQARFIPEQAKFRGRTPFERDRARLLHSSALRRLGAKTQVLGAGYDDFVRTRLTHTLEVAQVGRELAKQIGCDPDIVDTACLAHDLGHPPFGHLGEKTLNSLAASIGGFEGNAQTLRLVAHLELKVFYGSGRSAGLNLSRASLDAICKYPFSLGEGPKGAGSNKHGAYAQEADVFAWLREGVDLGDGPTWRRCIEADLMDISDDIAYSVHDIEDAIVAQRLVIENMKDATERRAALLTAQNWYCRNTPVEQLDAALTRLEREPFWVPSFDQSISKTAALKNCTSQLIGRFCSAVVQATREQHGREPLKRYDANLVVPETTMDEINVLKGIAAHYVMDGQKQQAVYREQTTIIEDVVSLLRRTGDKYLEPIFKQFFAAARDDTERERLLIDQVACLTDQSVRRWSTAKD